MNNSDSSEPNNLSAILKEISKNASADLILYNGKIDANGADHLVAITESPTNENVIFYLCTLGGNADAAYRIARCLQSKYAKFTLYVHGYCKSAGTIIAIGAHEIIMSDLGELGPLDVQISDNEEINKSNSGLNVFQTLTALKDQHINFYNQCLISTRFQFGLSTKFAANIAGTLAVGFFDPILSQIDPIKIGELDRAVKIAIKYGEILINNKQGSLTQDGLIRLVTQYPSHSFVIDRQEANEIFHNVRKPDALETKLNGFLNETMRNPLETRHIEKLSLIAEKSIQEPTDYEPTK